MNEALLDTDTVSFYFKGNPKAIHKINTYLSQYGYVNISLIT